MKVRIRKADSVFSKWIKTRDNYTCQRCFKRFDKDNARGLDCSHYHSRRKESTRFEPRNCDAVCTGCHMYFHQNPLEHMEWKKRQLGEKDFQSLLIQANQYQKKDDQAVILVYKALLKELESS